MEKKEAVREWCVHEAITLCTNRASVTGGAIATEDVISTAEQFESYITSPNPLPSLQGRNEKIPACGPAGASRKSMIPDD